MFWFAELLHGVLVISWCSIYAVFGLFGVVLFCVVLCVLCFGGFLVCICAVFGVLVYSCAVFGGFLVHFFAVFSVFGVLVHSCAVFGVILCVWCFGVVIVIFVLYLVCLVWCVLASVAQSSPAVTLSL